MEITKTKTEFHHEPIMLEEIIDFLDIKPDGVFVDCTLGGAGHSNEIVKRLSKKGRLIGIDKDDDALTSSKNRLRDFSNVTYVKSDFKNFRNILDGEGIDKVDGILIDLGVSSFQLDCPERGFSFRFDSRLDMRMDKDQKLTAFDVVNFYSPEKLLKILYEYGEENFAKQIVRNIVSKRNEKPIETTGELNRIIEDSLPKKVVFSSGGAAKKTFQAIRIEVNRELTGLDEALNSMISSLKSGGRICVLSFHSLEDRIVKNVFKEASRNCICPPTQPICTCGGHNAKLKILSKKPLTASNDEQKLNPRSTSAKLRVAERI